MVLLSCPVYADTQNPGVAVDIKLSCTARGISDAFTYVLTDEGGNGDTISLTDGQTGFFNKEYSDVGVYRYTLHQESGASKNIQYDDTIYKVDVYITNEEEGLSAVCAVYESGSNSKVDHPGFINTTTNVTSTPPTVSPTSRPITESPVNPTSGNSIGSGSPSGSGSGGSGTLLKSTADGSSAKPVQNAKTGDNSGVSFWILVAGMSFVVILASIAIKTNGRRGTH